VGWHVPQPRPANQSSAVHPENLRWAWALGGYALVAALRALGNAGRRPIILAITASDFDLNEREARTSGFDGYMLKPLDLTLLETKLAALMKCVESSSAS